ncbi:uncharacterized protein LOC123274620 isoform X2 [Cotesia glomerata]|uniref:uncharacterized protein LOC123274620 isoform X2 n=1 Tax=Cotesia glomerata TaxID=32391 RepID=UPI001D0326EA|nr:uncharacterized protein LOC123274620 isoform X2 [Cotesia glomerata]
MEPSIKVEVTRNNECIFNNSINISNYHKIDNLVENLKVMQRQVNDFLTTLVEKDSGKGECESQELSSGDDEEDSDDADTIDTKKCKFK